MTVLGFLFITMILISSAAAPIFACGSSCNKSPHKHKHKPPVTDFPPPIIDLPPVTAPVVPTCPIDTVKLGGCVDLLGGLIHIGIGPTEPMVNRCCPVLQGLVELEAAACICTTLKLKLLNLNIYIPIALQLLVTCGKTPPPGFTCIL